MSELVYSPPGSLEKFFVSEKFVDLAVGPVGSTKTTAGLLKIALEASRIAPCTDGIRRTRTAVVRNTRQMLWDTTIPDFLKWFGNAGVMQKTDSRFILRFDDIEAEVLFRGLDDANDVRRLLSLQLTNAVIDEFREIHKDIYEALAGRTGRYPDKTMVLPRPEWGVDDKGNPIGGCVTDAGKSAKRVWGMSNPPDMDTFWEQILMDPPDNMDVTIQPSGVSPEADWVHYLDSGYYESLMELHKNDPDWVDVYVHAKFGKSLSGKPVHTAFNRDIHVAKAPIRPLGATSPLLIGVDAGLTPAAVIGQIAYDGRLIIYNAIPSDGMGALRFAKEKLKPLLQSKFPGYKHIMPIDPAAYQRAQTDERSVADIYRTERFGVKRARTNALAARLSAVDKYLTSMVEGKPGILLCPEGAAPLISALAGKYRYKVSTKGETDETPEKNHPWSDICDGLQYLCMEADGGATFGAAADPNQRREVLPAPYRWGIKAR